MIRPPYKPGQRPPTADELNAIAARRGLSSFRTLPLKVELSGSANPYSWVELNGTRSGTDNAYELNDKEDLDGKETMLYPAPAGWWYFRCKGSSGPPAINGYIRVIARNACTRITQNGASVTIKDYLGNTVASGTTASGGVFLSPMLSSTGNPYTVTATYPGFTTATATVSLVTNMATVDVPAELGVGGPSVVTFEIFDICGEPLQGATISMTGPNGYASSGATDSSGIFVSDEIPRTWDYRGAGNPLGGLYLYTISHPDFQTVSSPGQRIACATNDVYVSTTPATIPCRYYSGRKSAGTDCWNTVYPGSLTVNADLSAYGPLYSPYSGTYSVNFDQCDASETNQGVYIGCIDMGDRYMAVSVIMKGDCDTTSVADVGFAWNAKGPGIGPCEGGIVSPSPIGTTCYGSGSDGCLTSYNVTDGAGVSVTS